MPRLPLVALSFFALALASLASAAEPSGSLQFKKTTLDSKFRSEGVAVGDFNKDGKMDIAAGYVWYEAPDWKMHTVLEKAPESNPMGYSNSFCTFADDVNGDGWTDILVVDFPGTPTWWFENPGKQESDKPWKKRTVTPVTNNESPAWLDIDGDGKKDLLAAFAPSSDKSDGPDRQMGFMTRAGLDEPFTIHPISAKAGPGMQRYSHGLGFGDVNGDKRNDILIPQGWWEAPADPKSTAEWTFHPAPFGPDCSNMYAFDFDGDGDNDVVSSAAHKTGIWWHEQLPEGKWKTHEIDKSFSQTHSLVLIDMNKDGLPDLVTGKRWWAHGPNGDDNPGAAPELNWFELKREGGKPVWTKHQIDDESGVGTQFEVADVNGDGKLDVAISNKRGVFYFEQQ